jgi:hypothetical protein
MIMNITSPFPSAARIGRVCSFLLLTCAFASAGTSLFQDDFADKTGQIMVDGSSTSGYAVNHDAGGNGMLGPLYNGRAKGLTVAGWVGTVQPMKAMDSTAGKLTVRAYIAPTTTDGGNVGTGTLWLCSKPITDSSAGAPSWNARWPLYGPGMSFSNEPGGWKFWLSAPTAAGHSGDAFAESPHAPVTDSAWPSAADPGQHPAAGYFKMAIDLDTGLADGFYVSTDGHEKKLISGFDMKGSWTAAEFRTRLATYLYIVLHSESTKQWNNGAFDEISVTVERKP